MPAHPIVLGPLQFGSKKDAAAHLRSMLNRYDVGDRVSVKDAEILRVALDRHPEAAEKVGCGIKDFSVRLADYGTQCFWANRTDDTTVKFSIKSCIYG